MEKKKSNANTKKNERHWLMSEKYRHMKDKHEL